MDLLERLHARDATVAVIGLGYVGLPLAGAFVDAGLRVLGVDNDPTKIDILRAGGSYLKHLGEDFTARLRAGGGFEPTADASRLREADAIVICVPTPLDAALAPDLSFVDRTTDAVAATLRPGQLVVLESTTYPGTTRGRLLPRLRQTGLTCGTDAGFYLAFSPEREDPGRRDHSVRTIPKLVGGVDEASTRVAAALYRRAVRTVVEVSSAEVAESAKLLENIYRAVNIAMVNELKTIFDAMGIDVWEVVAAASTKPFGFQPFYPGPGLGGHCIPIDPFYLSHAAASVGREARFIELAGRVNRAMPGYVVERTLAALRERGLDRPRRVLVLGLAYKPDIDDVRESPSFELIELFRAAGAHVDYHDPLVPRTHAMRRYGNLGMESITLGEAALAGYDAVVIATAHSSYDWPAVVRASRLVIDTRNATAAVDPALCAGKVVRA